MAVILADAMMILLLLRNSTSYFRPYRNYFVGIWAAFLFFPFRELSLFFLPDPLALQASTHAMIGAAVLIALLWGHLATQLYLYPAPFHVLSVFRPRRPIQLLFGLYTLPMFVTVIASFALPGAVASEPGQAVYVFSGTGFQAVDYSAEFLIAASTVIVAFVAYPSFVLARLRSQLKDPEIRHALRIIASTFGTISTLLLGVNAMDTFGISLIGPVHVVSVALLIIAVRAFSKPSFLKAFLGVLPTLESRYAGKRPDMRILLYKKNEEKYGPVARFANEGVDQDGLVIYFYRDDAKVAREGLARQGFASKNHLMKRNLRLVPFSSLYEDEDTLDEEAALTYIGQLTTEAKALKKNGLRIVVDYGDSFERPYSKFVNHLADPRWTSPDHYVWVLMAFSEDAFQGQETAVNLLKSKIDTVDLSDVVDTFSRTVGLSHTEIAGKKILLEYDPSSEYERVLRSLLSESYSNFERSVLFTRKDSPVYSALGRQTGAKIFLITPRVSYPRVEEENRVLLPAYDGSLLLDALDKTIQAYAGASFTVIFDGISHFIFTLGPDRALSLVRQAMELMISSKVTAVFLMNGSAHDQKTVSTFENLFDMEIVCNAGERIPRVKRSLTLET